MTGPLGAPSSTGWLPARGPKIVQRLPGTTGCREQIAAGLIIRFDHPDDPTGPSWIRPDDETSNVSRPDPSGADQTDAEHPTRKRKVEGSILYVRALAGLAGELDDPPN